MQFSYAIPLVVPGCVLGTLSLNPLKDSIKADYELPIRGVQSG